VKRYQPIEYHCSGECARELSGDISGCIVRPYPAKVLVMDRAIQFKWTYNRLSGS
jgi:hypothetical protein